MKNNNYLDKEEKDIIESFDRGEWNSIFNENRKTELQNTAKNTLKKIRRINIRLTDQDFRNIQLKALDEGLPYQTLVSMLIHKYIQGRITIN